MIVLIIYLINFCRCPIDYPVKCCNTGFCPVMTVKFFAVTNTKRLDSHLAKNSARLSVG